MVFPYQIVQILNKDEMDRENASNAMATLALK